MVRLLDVDDLPWLHSVFRKRYPNHDAATTERWFRAVVVRDVLNLYAVRTDDAFLVAMASVFPWLPADPEVNVICICADEDATWQVIALLRGSIEWARKRNAKVWRLTSDTSYDVKWLAMRVGARAVQSRFELALRGA